MNSQISDADSAKHTEPITQELIAETARERFGIPSLFPYQQLVITNILEANRALAGSAGSAGNVETADSGDNTENVEIVELAGNVKHDEPPKSYLDSILEEIPEHTSEPPPEPYSAPAKQIVILPTGLGKSLCFMLPALLMDGITLIIFPLLALIEDQSRRVQELGEEPAVLCRLS